MKKKLLSILVIALASITSSIAQDICSDSVAFYFFNGNLQNHVGTNAFTQVNGTIPLAYTASDIGPASSQALDLSSPGARATISALPIGSAARTVSLWIKPTDPFTTYHPIFEYGDGAGSVNKLFYLGINPQGNYRFVASSAFQLEYTNGGPILDTWQHLALVYDGAQLRFYVNGDLRGSENVTLNTMHYTNPYFYLNSVAIDDLRIYSRALDIVDISALYTMHEYACLPISAPTNLNTTFNESLLSVELNWTDNANNELFYSVERSTDEMNWTNISFDTQLAEDLPSNTVSFVDNNVLANTTYFYRVNAGDNFISSAYSNHSQISTTVNSAGVNDTDAKNNIKVFPNPAKEFIQLTGVKAGSELRLVALNGTVVSTSKSLSTEETISIAHLENGVYFLHVFDNENFVTTKKILVNR